MSSSNNEESTSTFSFEKPSSNKQQKKKKAQLVFKKVEALVKIYWYYTTYAKEVISYINYKLTLEDVLF
ncbi:9793_t:CDS:2, partial [Cetraspora pellucida]